LAGIRKKDTLLSLPLNPQEGDKVTGILIGKNTRSRYIWRICADCGKGRWELIVKNNPRYLRCRDCADKYYRGKHSHGWKGGRWQSSDGYIWVYVPLDDFYHSMCHNKNNYVMEHRIIIARSINRCLNSWEVVHHKNGVRNDNRLDNLLLLPNSAYHTVDVITKTRINSLEKQVAIYKARIDSLDLKDDGTPSTFDDYLGIGDTDHSNISNEELKILVQEALFD
jgi:hypothetical protein